MSLNPIIVYENRRSNTEPDGTVTVQADVYIEIFDENGLPANGNYLAVTVKHINDPIMVEPDATFQIAGMKQLVFSGTISRTLTGGQNVFTRNFVIASYTVPGKILPLSCDAVVNSVTIDRKESDLGAADGQVSVNASSSYLPIRYSLNNGPFQDSNVFAGLTAGGYVANITDANKCTAYYDFNLFATKNLLISDSLVSIGGSNISRWNAAFNPVTFTYQRKDLEVTGALYAVGATNVTSATLISVNGTTSGIKTGDLIYINAQPYIGVYTVLQAQINGVVIDTPFTTTTTGGFLNSNTLFGCFKKDKKYKRHFWF